MTQAEAHEVLVTAFQGLNQRQRNNLRWHAEHGTPILCGHWDKALLYTDGKGGA